MSTYTVNIGIKSARGWQSYDVEADSEQQAIAEFTAGNGKYNDRDSDLEITELDYDAITVYENPNRRESDRPTRRPWSESVNSSRDDYSAFIIWLEKSDCFHTDRIPASQMYYLYALFFDAYEGPPASRARIGNRR